VKNRRKSTEEVQYFEENCLLLALGLYVLFFNPLVLYLINRIGFYLDYQ